MKFNIITLGCKVNTYESEYMLESLKKAGFIYNEEKPNIIIVNTCSVTNMADHKSLKLVRKSRRENPNAILVVCGCSTQNDISKYQDLNIQILIGNRGKSNIVALINNYLENKEIYNYITNNRELDFEDMRVQKFTTHTRAFIKIQDGCNNFCSYCIIPYTRGNIRSKNFNEVLEEARILTENGHKEIVLTGIHTGSYQDSGHDLSDLITALANIEKLERIRLSSIEITELDDKFLNTLATTKKLANHLHIPLQSGSDAILKRMNRKYDLAYYHNKINKIREIRPDISITTDCIVGHPYETDNDFKEYLDFCKSIEFSKMHVFPYSLRNGTAASFMPQVENTVKKERAKVLGNLSKELEDAYMSKFIGKDVNVLTEEYSSCYTIGHTSNYLKVAIPKEVLLNNNYTVHIEALKGDLLIGNIVTCNEEVTI